MTTAKRTVARKKPAAKANSLGSIVRQFLTLRVQREALEEREGTLKKSLQQTIEASGYEDDKGHFWLDLDEEVAVDGFGTCKALKRERRVSVGFAEATAEEILKAKGIYDQCTTLVPVYDEEEIRKAHFQGLLSDEDIDAIYPSKVIWALKPVKA